MTNREGMIEALVIEYEKCAESHADGFAADDVCEAIWPLIERWLAEARLEELRQIRYKWNFADWLRAFADWLQQRLQARGRAA